MPITTIPWNDGSGDNIYLSASSQVGDQSVSVTSDPTTGAARSKVVTFDAVGVTPVTLTINQEAGVVEKTLKVYLSSYVPKATDGSWYNLTNASSAYGDPASNTSSPCAVVMTRGAGANTWCYFKFDTSSLPANANIVSVSVKCRPGTSTGNSNYIASKGCVLCSGTTEKTSSITTNTNNTLSTFPATTWTRAEVSDIRIKLYGTRGSSNTTSNYSLRMYGAELTIVYTE